MWFSTASIITACCLVGVVTCIRRAWPIAGCGISPSPAISFEVSTMMTRLLKWSANVRATSRSIVVLPTPGRPKRRTLLPDSMRSSIILMVPKIARPTRQVSPTMRPSRLRMAEIRCRVRSIPARLSSPKVLMRAVTYSISDSVTSWELRTASRCGKRASGERPRSRTTSSSSLMFSCWHNG